MQISANAEVFLILHINYSICIRSSYSNILDSRTFYNRALHFLTHSLPHIFNMSRHTHVMVTSHLSSELVSSMGNHIKETEQVKSMKGEWDSSSDEDEAKEEEQHKDKKDVTSCPPESDEKSGDKKSEADSKHAAEER